MTANYLDIGAKQFGTTPRRDIGAQQAQESSSSGTDGVSSRVIRVGIGIGLSIALILLPIFGHHPAAGVTATHPIRSQEIATMASDVEICNRALQKLGAQRIAGLEDNSKNARECNAAYTALRDAELRAHPWNFSITRVQLAAAAEAPAFGRARSFPLPSTFLRILPPYPEENLNDRDWQIEDSGEVLAVYTNDSAPLNVRYVQQVADANKMDPLFREALATKLALELCEAITQSNSKKDLLFRDYDTIIKTAKHTNAIENVPQQAADDTWITARF